jgi:hypothetical protein
MIDTLVRGGAVVALLVVFVACGSSGPTSPSGFTPPPPSRSPAPPPTPTPAPTPRPPIGFPPLSGPSRTFIFEPQLTARLWSANPNFVSTPHDYTSNSRFVLYDNGAFLLQYPPSSFGDGRFPGAHRDANGVIMFLFEFQGRAVDDIWDDATGTLKGDSLTIQFQESMQHADFEDAVYVLMQ